MPSYKIPQNVEAEDKLLGPFTFRQFIFLIIAATAVFVAWLLSRLNGWLTLIPLPVILIFGFLGVYRREDQPVETYLMAALSYFFKPHKRVWDPEGITENIKLITPPKMAAPKVKTLGGEERGQLTKLAHVMDTRGWSVKRPELNEPNENAGINFGDRLVNPTPGPSQEPLDIHSSDDVLDPINFPDAQKYRQLAENTHTDARAQAIKKMRSATLEAGSTEQVVSKDPTQPEPKIQDTKPETQNTHTALPESNISQKPAPQSSTKHLATAELSVHHLAQQVKRVKEKPTAPKAGQEIELSQGKGAEIDLPNRGEKNESSV